jgi:hypothetical protein
MGSKRITTDIDIQSLDELKKCVMVSAVATGNTFALHDLFACIREFSDVSKGTGLTPELIEKLAYLLPDDEMADSPGYRAAIEIVENHKLEDNFVSATILEETAKRAVVLGKFTYAEDAYKLLGIKKEMVALFSQAGEQLLREGKPRHAATAFHVAASIEQPIEPYFQYLGSKLHADCLHEPKKCVTALPDDLLVDAGIRFLLANEPLADRLVESAQPEQKKEILATLAVSKDLYFPALVKNLREAADTFSSIDDGKPEDYAQIGSVLLGRTTATGEAWQYLKEFCFEHPLGALCVCLKPVRRTSVMVPVIRDGRSLIEFLLPPEYLET